MKDIFGRKRSLWWKIRQMLPWQAQDAIFSIRMAYQRASRGFDDRFWWSHHDTHSEMMVAMFDQFIKRHMGYPMMFECKHKKTKANCVCGSKKWEKILKEMQDGFKAALEWENCGYSKKEDTKRKKLEKKFKKGMELYAKHYFSLWD